MLQVGEYCGDYSANDVIEANCVDGIHGHEKDRGRNCYLCFAYHVFVLFTRVFMTPEWCALYHLQGALVQGSVSQVLQ